MDGEKQILSEESPNECHGIEAPSLIQDSIAVDEEKNTKENVIGVEKTKMSETQDEDMSANFLLNKKENEPTKDGETQKHCEKNDEETSDERLPDESSATKDEDSSKNAQRSNADGEKDSSNTLQSEKTQDVTEESENTTSNGNHFVEVTLAEKNNNSNEKDSVRRARFSSEIVIQPKAYFQAGTDTVVTMPPSGISESDDVFKEETTPPGKSPNLVLNAKPSNAVLPQTFLPLTVFSCLFCCPLIGLFAVYKSYSVRQFIKKGEMRRANEASQHARQLGVLTLFIGFFFILAIVIIAVLVSVLT